MPKYRVMFANFPGNGVTCWQTSAWCTKTAVEMNQDTRISEVRMAYYGPDTPITMLRNRCVRDALDQGYDYLLMIDSDMSPDSQLSSDPNSKPFWKTAWEFMMDRREKVGRPSLMPATIAAPYCGPPPHECCYIFRWKNYETASPDGGYKLEMIEREDSAFRSGIEEVAALPTGLILYDVRLFNLIPKPWFDYEWTDETNSQKASTEDVYQTRNASLCRCPQYVAWDCWADHVKTKVVTKPRPITVECLSDKFHEAINSSRSSKLRLTIVGEPEENGSIADRVCDAVEKGKVVDGREFQYSGCELPVERNLGMEDGGLVHEDCDSDEA